MTEVTTGTAMTPPAGTSVRAEKEAKGHIWRSTCYMVSRKDKERFRAVDFVMRARSCDQHRKVLMSACAKNNLLAATDGRRLHQAPVPGIGDGVYDMFYGPGGQIALVKVDTEILTPFPKVFLPEAANLWVRPSKEAMKFGEVHFEKKGAEGTFVLNVLALAMERKVFVNPDYLYDIAVQDWEVWGTTENNPLEFGGRQGYEDWKALIMPIRLR